MTRSPAIQTVAVFEAPAAARDRDHAHRERRHGPEAGEPGAERHPRRQRGRGERSGPLGEERGRCEDQRQRHGVVARVPALVGEHAGVEDQEGAEHREPANAPGAAQAPGGEQRHEEPAEIQHRREHVAPGDHHPRGVQELGVRRVEPAEQNRGRVVEVPDLARLGEPGRERQVVPLAVEAVHALLHGGDRRDQPVVEDDRSGGDRDADLEPAAAEVRRALSCIGRSGCAEALPELRGAKALREPGRDGDEQQG